MSGKRAAKAAAAGGIRPAAEAMDRPLIGIVSRFTRQKGTDILAEVAGEIVAEDVYLVALGAGEPEYEALLARHGRTILRAHRRAHRLRQPAGASASRPAPTCF